MITVRTRKKSCCGKIIVRRKARGYMPGFAKHLAKKLGGDPDFFTKCMADEETASYPEDNRKALCARAHKLAIGRYPAEDPESERGETLRKPKKKEYRLVVSKKSL